MRVTEYKGYEVHLPLSGGKAGKGCNATSSVQLRAHGRIVKQFRFVLSERDSWGRAVKKAKIWVDAQNAGVSVPSQGESR